MSISRSVIFNFENYDCYLLKVASVVISDQQMNGAEIVIVAK